MYRQQQQVHKHIAQHHPQARDTQARQNLDLVERVPAYVVDIPWGIDTGDTTINQVMAIVSGAEGPAGDTTPARASEP